MGNSKLSMIFNQAFEIRKNPFPWPKAINAGICAATPALIGLLSGNLSYGMQAGIGGFTYLYVFNEPYAERAKKLFFVMLGMSLSVGLGTLIAPTPILAVLMMGIIGFVGTFIFGALHIPGPAAIFFVLGFAMTTNMPIDASLALERAGLVLLGGLLSWVIGMVGWFFHPHAPEITAVKKVYFELVFLLESVGTANFNQARQRTVLQLKDTKETILSGYISWHVTDLYKRLILLNEKANDIFLYILNHYGDCKHPLPPELAASVRGVAKLIDQRLEKPLLIHQPDHQDEKVSQLFSKIFDAEAVMNEPVTKINHEIQISKPSIKMIFSGAFDKNSIVFLSALRYGTILTIAAFVAYSFDFYRSYWIPLSCGAVMLGSTIISTFHRSIQRTIGTIIGIIAASIILSFHPAGYLIVLISFILTALTELFIVRNYALAAMFITPNALLIAETTTHIHTLSLFATARITDVLIGCLIGVVGTFLVGRRTASHRLPHIMAKTIRSQMQFLQVLFSEQMSGNQVGNIPAQNKMHTNLNNLRIFYNTALGEIPTNKSYLERLWPAIFSLEQLGFHLDACLKHTKRSVLTDENLAQLLLIYETLANAIEQQHRVMIRKVPEILGFPKIQKEIADLQVALHYIQDQ